MRTYTITLNANLFYLLKRVITRRAHEMSDDGLYQRQFSVPEILETRELSQILLASQPNERKESHGEEKEVS